MNKGSTAIGLVLTAVLLAGAAPSPPATPQPTPTSQPAVDPMFSQPYVDIDEWRDAPVRHRYVHGGFRGTDTRFSFYLPPKEQYQGRFFQHFTPAPDNENLAQRVPPGEGNKIGFAIASRGYFIETNGGGQSNTGGPGLSADPTIGAFRANAAAAQYSRVVALQMYGGRRPYGYAYGGSGGAYRTVGSYENTRGVWDGVVPYVLGTPMASPSNFTVRMHAMRVLEKKFPRIVDAVEPGGSGDPYAGLSDEEAAALREATRMGFPVKSWFGWKTMGVHAFPAIYGGVLAADPSYFTDFWTKPGYLGFDHPEQLAPYRMQHQTAVVVPITAAEAARLGINPRIVNGTVDGDVDNSFAALQGEGGKRVVGYRMAHTPPSIDFLGGDLIVLSGAAKGQRLSVSKIAGDIVVLGMASQEIATKIAPGDAVQVDNSNYLAAQTYHRHQVPGRDYPGYDQFRDPDGKPLYPQRPMLLGPLFAKGAAGTVPNGQWDGKMILVESLWDREAWPWQAVWYRDQVRKHYGAATDQHFRLWFTDHALHGDSVGQEDATHTVGYLGMLHQALRDLASWVEKGTPPPGSTRFSVTGDTQIVVPATASERRGIQPVVSLLANGSKRVEVGSGRPVRLTGTIAVPPGAGSLIAAQWDLDGSGSFASSSPIERNATKATVTLSHSFAQPGTYFVTLRGISQRQGDATTPYARLQNLDRVRIIVR
ncbi:PKD domain-containing protein [Novosphingobium sp. JCM 18896]|uniref:PKD domain-containing protein n=1 Tax=Novosphingobium sp. JCM 18896 TaxID=2989731 RepID=UPI0022219B7B|nr:PKD domain-containing protein [Novosphingobium sp. JCM 18896]MCW1429539.1 PKD domain-containing protein [Novosphingobium sp. JCM 18896]